MRATDNARRSDRLSRRPTPLCWLPVAPSRWAAPQHLAQLGHDTVFAALCELADNFDQHGSPINYERRRTLITPETLTDEQWRRICRATRTHPGLGRRFLDAQRYLLTRLTGSDLNDPDHPLKFNSANDRGVSTSFTTTLSTPVRQALHQHAAEHLHDLGIDEPAAWEPPREWAPSLVPPGREPTDIDLDRLRRLIFEDDVTAADAADTLTARTSTTSASRWKLLSTPTTPSAREWNNPPKHGNATSTPEPSSLPNSCTRNTVRRQTPRTDHRRNRHLPAHHQ